MSTATPLMRQYFSIKEQYPESILLFQVGDFYEIFFDDAHKAAAFLGIALTKRGEHNQEPIPLCGVPIHTVDHYLLKLVKGGFRVAICNQLSPPQPGTVVERDVTQVLTPGTLTDPQMLEDKSASYCASCYATKDAIGVVFVEILTGHIFATLLSANERALLTAELGRFMPDEVIVDPDSAGWLETHIQKAGYVISHLPHGARNHAWWSDFTEWQQSLEYGNTGLLQQSRAAEMALYTMYAYIKKHNTAALQQCRHMYWYSPDDFLLLDSSTQRNLELVKNMYDGTRADTLFSVLDHAVTAMGSRMIKKWITRPLVSRQRIEQRHAAVGYFCRAYQERDGLRKSIRKVGDLERVVGRIALGKAQPHDYRLLRQGLEVLPEIRRALFASDVSYVSDVLAQHIGDFTTLYGELERALEDYTSDWIIKRGYDAELDRLRDLIEDASQKLLELEQNEQERTGIGSLKIRYNSVHGYVIEVTKPNLHLVPDDFIRVQTLVNRERYTTERLRDIEYDITHAHNTVTQRQQEVYNTVVTFVQQYVADLKKTADACAKLDAILGFAQCAHDNTYVQPTMHDGRDIAVEAGCHPVVARQLGHNFVPNDVSLTEQSPLWIITGPNMGGKSTFLRQTALLVLMAQAGAFVPARSAYLPVVDRIFTRIGAADQVAHGKSTFLVEMEETALICNQATDRSLVILDEVGRGTSTYDGYAIAQAVVEYIYTYVKARCLFATHYHELIALSEHYSGMAAYHAASRQMEYGIVLLHKIVEGAADGSFGVEVAKQAHLPAYVLDRAHAVLQQMKHNSVEVTPAVTDTETVGNNNTSHLQYELEKMRSERDEAYRKLQYVHDIDVENLSPKQALDVLWRVVHE